MAWILKKNSCRYWHYIHIGLQKTSASRPTVSPARFLHLGEADPQEIRSALKVVQQCHGLATAATFVHWQASETQTDMLLLSSMIGPFFFSGTGGVKTWVTPTMMVEMRLSLQQRWQKQVESTLSSIDLDGQNWVLSCLLQHQSLVAPPPQSPAAPEKGLQLSRPWPFPKHLQRLAALERRSPRLLHSLVAPKGRN